MKNLAALMAEAEALADTEIERQRVALWRNSIWKWMLDGRAEYEARTPRPEVKQTRPDENTGLIDRPHWTLGRRPTGAGITIPSRSSLPISKFPATRSSTASTCPTRISTARPAGEVVHELHRVQRAGLQQLCGREHQPRAVDPPAPGDGLRPAQRIRPRRLRHRRVPLRVLRHQGAAPAEATRRQVSGRSTAVTRGRAATNCGPATKAWR